jgi:hypothetical protein
VKNRFTSYHIFQKIAIAITTKFCFYDKKENNLSYLAYNSIIGPKLIALDNVWKADQPALVNRAFTFLRVKEKYWRRLQCYQYVTICLKLMETS